MGKLRPREVGEPAGDHQTDKGAELGSESSVAPELLSVIRPNVTSALPSPGEPATVHGVRRQREGSTFPDVIACTEGPWESKID